MVFVYKGHSPPAGKKNGKGAHARAVGRDSHQQWPLLPVVRTGGSSPLHSFALEVLCISLLLFLLLLPLSQKCRAEVSRQAAAGLQRAESMNLQKKKPSLPSQAENKRAKGLDLCMTEHIWYKICSNAAAVAKEKEWRNGRGTTYVRSV